ncbi:RNA methyltransferase [Dechloromonas sp. CZR5]|uniref:RNA methyltransferase n=1 Tax=Dechloromonas sp. CZR5 TaxID=2608630 RepID=UPI00123DECBA|nr:RNA methyltransferase [Dechloromonas sp. CZR5]
MRIEAIRQTLYATGAKDCHVDRVLRAWAQGQSLDSGPRHQPAADFLPLGLRNALPGLSATLNSLARVRSEHAGEDGARLLVELADGQLVESVLLPRDGLCISTQVGCAVGCTFCMTGRDGLLRQVDSAEMVAQVVLARRQRKVSRVVFMGMGEPSHNIDNVLEAIDTLGTYGAIGHKNLVFSTVGDYRVFERLPAGRVRPALAISLHTTRPELRKTLLPKAAPIEPGELVELAEAYARRTGYPIQYQWTLIEGVNDSEAEMDGIVRLLTGKYALMNLIPYNATAALDYRRPPVERVTALTRYLHARGIRTTVRNSAGQDVDGGCGQLRARNLEAPRKLRRIPVLRDASPSTDSAA